MNYYYMRILHINYYHHHYHVYYNHYYDYIIQSGTRPSGCSTACYSLFTQPTARSRAAYTRDASRKSRTRAKQDESRALSGPLAAVVSLGAADALIS